MEGKVVGKEGKKKRMEVVNTYIIVYIIPILTSYQALQLTIRIDIAQTHLTKQKNPPW